MGFFRDPRGLGIGIFHLGLDQKNPRAWGSGVPNLQKHRVKNLQSRGIRIKA